MYPLKIQELLDIAASIVVVINCDGIVKLINKKGCEALGYRKEEIEGKNWFLHFVPEDEREKKLHQFKEYVRHGCANEFKEGFVLTKSNHTRIISWSNSSMMDKEGKIVAMLRSGEDITEKRILQDMLAMQDREKRKQMLAAVLDAQEKERLHIANELHDNVGQILTTCKLLLEGELRRENTPPSLAHTYHHLQHAIDEIRTISHKLNPAQLTQLGLVSAIRDMVKKINMADGPQVRIEVENDVGFLNLGADISLSVFRIVQEQLNNILKHADAKHVEISLNCSGKAIELEMIDDGKGFTSAVVNKGLGLKNIYNRAELFNGKAVIHSAPGEGCTLSVYFPLPI